MANAQEESKKALESIEANWGGGNPSQQGLYSKVAKYSDVLIYQAFKLALEGKQESTRLGAIKLLINKILPDLKQVEVNGGTDNGISQPIKLFINTGAGFIPANIQSPTSPAGSDPQGQPQVQDISMASESSEDNNSNIRDGETGSS